MHHDYGDIISRAGPPGWWREGGVPAYGLPLPEKVGSIYADTVVLSRIACQDCGTQFVVMQAALMWTQDTALPRPEPDGLEAWHYGDPPRHDCPGAGESMNCVDLEIIRVWTRHRLPLPMYWERRRELEGAARSSWADDEIESG